MDSQEVQPQQQEEQQTSEQPTQGSQNTENINQEAGQPDSNVQEEILELNEVQANIVQMEEAPIIELDINQQQEAVIDEGPQQEQELPKEQQTNHEAQQPEELEELQDLNEVNVNIVQMEEAPIIELDKDGNVADQPSQQKASHTGLQAQPQEPEIVPQGKPDEQFLESVYETVQQTNPENNIPQEEQSQFEYIDKSHQQKFADASQEQEEQFIAPTLHLNDEARNNLRQVVEEESKQDESVKEEGFIVDETKDTSSKKVPQQPVESPQRQPPPPEILDQKEQIIQQFQKSLDEAIFLKNQGNQWYQQKNFLKAIEQYNLSAGLCDPQYLMQCPEEQLKQFKKLRITLLSNLSACYLNLGDFNSCITHANIVIQVESGNQKAWYRRAQAYQAKGEFEEAWRDIDAAWNLVKNTTQDVEIFNKRKEIKEQLKQANKESQVFYQNMLNNTNSTQPKTTDSKLEQSGLQKPIQKSETPTTDLQYGDIVFKTTASVLLASSMTKFVLEDQLLTKTGLIETLVLGTTTASVLFFKKTWQRLSFATITAGFLAAVIIKKQAKQ